MLDFSAGQLAVSQGVSIGLTFQIQIRLIYFMQLTNVMTPVVKKKNYMTNLKESKQFMQPTTGSVQTSFC